MTSIVSGIVTNGVIIPAVPLPEGTTVEVVIQSESQSTNGGDVAMSPSELRKLPREKREEILAAGAALAEQLYAEDKDLTGFDAFSEELDDDDTEKG